MSGVTENVKVNNIEKVDLLFMVDNSNSMEEEQANLAAQFPTLINVLASGDINGDGEQDFPPVRSLQVGVVTSDMGTGGFVVPTCTESNRGDDGVLRTVGRTAIPGCMASYPPFLAFEPAGGGDPNAFAQDVACVATTGTGGCGFEQQLEAVLKAVTPSDSSLTFSMNTVGHADGANAGFVRDDSLLAIIMVTDEDDCSAIDQDLFNPSSGMYTGDLNLRCFQFPNAVHPVERYVSGLLASRQDPDLLVYAAITGVPPAIAPGGTCSGGSGCPEGTICQEISPGQEFCLAQSGDDTSFANILANPAMQETPDPMMPNRLLPSCNEPGTGFAFPPRRIVEVARQLEQQGSNGIVTSICRMDFTGAISAIINKIADVLGNVCLPRSLNRDATSEVNCDVVEQLPPPDSGADVVRCEQIADLGRSLLRTEADGSEVCTIAQIPITADIIGTGNPPPGVGWYYDDYTADVMTRCEATPQRISFTAGAEPRTGSTVRLECLQSVEGTPGMVGVGTSCFGNAAVCDEANSRREIMDLFPNGLICDPASVTCQPSCESDNQCPGGFTCFDADGADEDMDGIDQPLLCVNPTCQAG